MAILDRLFPRRPASESLTGQTRKTGNIKAVSETPGVLWNRTTTSAGVHVDEYEALTISAVFAACFRLANVAAMLPVGIYQKDADGKRKEQTAHPASRMLAIEANGNQTAFMCRHFMQFWKPLFGAACAEIGWDGAGRPRYLWPLEPWRVYPEHDEANRGQALNFIVDGTRRVAAADMIYVPHMTDDGVCGQGFLHYALESLGSAIAADRSASRFFQNDMKPGGILYNEGNPKKEDRDAMREGWQGYHGGVHNRGKVGVLWGGWKWLREAGMIDPDKAELLETRQWSVLEVARWLNVPPHWLAELARATWANIESQSIEALIYTVGPLLVATEQEYDRKLLDPPRLYCKHNVNALLRADMKTRAEFYRLMKEIGVYNTNMILSYEDENGIGPEGDQRFVPVNWQPADDLMTGGEAQQKAAAAKPVAAPAKPVASPVSEKQSVVIPAESVSNPSASASLASSSAGIVEAVRGVAEQALSWLAKREINESRRAAKKPNEMMAWMDGFYPGFEGMMADALGPIAHLSYQLGKQLNPDLQGVSSEPWAKGWIETSREELLTAMDCKAEEWPNKSAALFTVWEGRAANAAKAIAESVGK